VIEIVARRTVHNATSFAMSRDSHSPKLFSVNLGDSDKANDSITDYTH
jgi:hypothetical protein